MTAQFDYLTSSYHVALIPFRGDSSLHQKWQLAKLLSAMASNYDKPITLLYFGDYDAKGLEIPKSALKDIRQWASTPFEFSRAGINSDHTDGLIENPDAPGKYQWEALPEQLAWEIVTEPLDKLIERTKLP
jgi:hypothetical protein